jgi:dienelactone hydrolase
MNLMAYDLVRVLDKKGTVPPGMVRVQAVREQRGLFIVKTDVELSNDFYIDRYEVTNKQYKEFVNAGGYGNKKYWNQKFIQRGRELTWEQAMERFVDESGQHGPSNWQGGDYPRGQDDYPVSGVSWYEAAAYAEFAGKSLPTQYHWQMAKGVSTPFGDIVNIFSDVPAHSNFNGKGPVQVGTLAGMTSYGAFDMAGNVREWCWNETPKGRLILGGAWDDNPYMFGWPAQLPPMDRSAENGFRCARYFEPEKIPAATFQLVKWEEPIDVRKLKPVSDPVFQVYKEQFSYDRTNLNARVESRKESAEGWALEKVTMDAVYGRERVSAYLFLPKNAAPPYQTVVFFPSGSALGAPSSKDIEDFSEVPMFLSFIVKNGRAVLFPIYKGTFERSDAALSALLMSPEAANTRLYTEWYVQIVKDFRRCLDYLETRPEIDNRKLAFYGMSWGADFGATIPAVENRLKAQVLLGGGLDICGRPEVNPINYVTRVKIPTLILIGKYDAAVSYKDSHQPMFDLLGTPTQDKLMPSSEAAHIPPRNDIIKWTLTWLDRYLGPVKR